MRVLIIGGSGLISTGIVKHLTHRGADISMFNRGQRENTLDTSVKRVLGDRNQPGAFAELASQSYDVVIDMICFTPAHAEATIAAFAGRCQHLLFCSTVCTYGAKIPPQVVIEETFQQEPVSTYGRDKVACEQLFMAAHRAGKFNVTIVRPSHTYGPGSGLIDQLLFDTPAWDRIERGEPVLAAGDGMALWQSTHRDDCGALFAYAALNPRTYGQAYNATRDEIFTWADDYRTAAAALNRKAHVLFMPADWIIRHDPQRFGLLREITRFHGAYSSAKGKRDVPEFRCAIDFHSGAAETFSDMRRRGAWVRSDPSYQAMVAAVLAMGIEPVEL